MICFIEFCKQSLGLYIDIAINIFNNLPIILAFIVLQNMGCFLVISVPVPSFQALSTWNRISSSSVHCLHEVNLTIRSVFKYSVSPRELNFITLVFEKKSKVIAKAKFE